MYCAKCSAKLKGGKEKYQWCGHPIDRETILAYKKRAKRGDASAALELAQMYYCDGRYREAAPFYQTAADAGDRRAMSQLGGMYMAGEGVSANLEKAISLTVAGAARGKKEEAWEALWDFYAGNGLVKEALIVCERAGRQGFGTFMSRAAYIHWLGHIHPGCRDRAITPNQREATRWYRRAANAGDAEGMYCLAHCFEKGAGVKRNLVESVKWFRKAAEAGHCHAADNLGRLYQEGKGVPVDRSKALAWYMLGFGGNMMTELKSQMTAAEKKKARQFVADFRKTGKMS